MTAIHRFSSRRERLDPAFLANGLQGRNPPFELLDTFVVRSSNDETIKVTASGRGYFATFEGGSEGLPNIFVGAAFGLGTI